MRVLVLQLTRFGDVLQTIPVLSALQRKYPNAEIDLLARKKYSAAAKIFQYANVIDFESDYFLKPAFENDDYSEDQFWQSIHHLESFCDNLAFRNYDLILNLSYSPMSSYMTHYISNGDTSRVRGYSRHADGFLNISDDTSAYFYGQVGVNRPNRFHVIDLFTSVVEVNLIDEDYRIPFVLKNPMMHDNYAVLHVGASHERKRVPSAKWNQICRELVKNNVHVVFIGTESEKELIESCAAGMNAEDFTCLAGKTKMEELFALIKGASFYLGGDSGPLHICNFTDTHCYNLSNKEVNFWETGPKSKYSRVWYEDNFATLDARELVENILRDRHGQESLFIKGSKFSGYLVKNEPFEWKLILALYTGQDFPSADHPYIIQAFLQLNEVNEIILHQLQTYRDGNNEQYSIIQTAEQIMQEIARECVEVAPLVDWLTTEKIRVGPTNTDSILNQYKEIHFKMKRIASLYIGEEWQKSEGSHGQDRV